VFAFFFLLLYNKNRQFAITIFKFLGYFLYPAAIFVFYTAFFTKKHRRLQAFVPASGGLTVSYSFAANDM